MQWLQGPNQNNADNLHNVRRAAIRHFRNKKKEYIEAKIDELETNRKMTNVRYLYRGINAFQKGIQPRTNTVKDEKGDLVTDSYSILATWRKHFSQLLHLYWVNDVGREKYSRATST
jgi:hypothetical protein